MTSLLLVSFACTPDPGGYGRLPADDTGPSADEDTDWERCDLRPGSGDRDAECATFELPLDHDDPGAGTLPALVKRRPGNGAGQLWVMHGGPGGSAVDDLAILPAGLAGARPDLTLYAVDHRGIGGTGRLGCEEQEAADSEGGAAISDAEWPACVAATQAEWGAALDQVTTTASARDVGWLIERLAEPGEPVFVYGGSYGTYLALRYLQIFPDQPTGVVLDGISPPGDGFIGYDAGMSGIGEALMSLCSADDACASHFDDDPLQVARGLADLYDSGHCPALGTNGDFVRYFMGSLLFYDKLRDLVPATVVRFDRCEGDDVAVLVHLYGAVVGALGALPPPPTARFRSASPPAAGNDGEGFSYGLFYHVALSEMWYAPGDVSTEQVEADWRSLSMSTGLETWLAPKVDWWPIYDKDAYWGEVADFDGPLLMLQGGLDPATTPEPALALASHFTGPGQTLAWFPYGAHGLVNGSTLPDGGNCGERLLLAFLDEPQSDLDTSCIDETLGVQWDGFPDYNLYFMGTGDIWGG